MGREGIYVSGAQTSTRYRPAATSWSTRKRSPGASIPSSFVTSSTGAADAAAVESMRAETASAARGWGSFRFRWWPRLPFPFVRLCPVPRGVFGWESLGVSWHRACCAPAIYTFSRITLLYIYTRTVPNYNSFDFFTSSLITHFIQKNLCKYSQI